MAVVGEEVREKRNGWGLTPGYERGCSSEEGVWGGRKRENQKLQQQMGLEGGGKNK